MGVTGVTHCYDADINKLIKKSYSYLLNNFHKFSQENKIKVALKMVDRHAESVFAHLENRAEDDELINQEIQFSAVPSNGDGKDRLERFLN